MSRERAEQSRLSQTLETHAGIILPDGIGQPPDAVNDPRLGGVNIQADTTNPPGTDRVMAKAEKSAEKTMRQGANESRVPDRSLGAVNGHDADGAVLPVIGEAAESASQLSKTPSKVSQDDTQRQCIREEKLVLGNANMPSDNLGEMPPPTPPKQNGSRASREEHEGRPSWGGGPPPTPPKDDKFRMPISDGKDWGRASTDSTNKNLPLLPPVVSTATLSVSPAPAQEDEMAELRRRFA